MIQTKLLQLRPVRDVFLYFLFVSFALIERQMSVNANLNCDAVFSNLRIIIWMYVS